MDQRAFPHILYTALSRVTKLSQLHIVYNYTIHPEHFPIIEDNLKWYLEMIN